MTKTALLLLADGAEEMEAVILADVLRRGGVEVTVAAVDKQPDQPVLCSRQTKIVGDSTFDAVKDKTFDAVILPGNTFLPILQMIIFTKSFPGGGPGAKALAAHAGVGELLKRQESSGAVIAAVCAAPTALLAHGIAKGKKVTSYPAFKDQLQADYDYQEVSFHTSVRRVKDI